MQPDAVLRVLRALLNLPDLIILAIILICLILGLRRGFLGSLYGFVGKLIALAAAFFAAKTAAPAVAKWIVTPIIGGLFEKQAALGAAAGLLDGLRKTVAAAAQSMAESLAFLFLLLLGIILFGWLVSVAGHGLHFIAHHTPLGFLDALAGGAVGIVTGLVLVALLLIGIDWFFPITYSALGVLSPERVSHTLLLAHLIDILPVAI